jgi:hypothetical protein
LSIDVVDANHLFPTFIGHAVLMSLPRAARPAGVAFPTIALATMNPQRVVRFGIPPCKQERGFIGRSSHRGNGICNRLKLCSLVVDLSVFVENRERQYGE